MRGSNHLIGGAALAAGFGFYDLDPMFMLGALIGSKAPDFLELPVRILHSVRVGIIPHRTVTHWGLLWLAGFVWLLIAEQSPVTIAFLGFFMGGLVHLLQDACTPMGVPIIFPSEKRVSFKLIHGWVSELFVNVALVPFFFVMGYVAALSL